MEGGVDETLVAGSVLAPGFSLTLWAEVSHAPWPSCPACREAASGPIAARGCSCIPFESTRPKAQLTWAPCV